MPIGALRIVLAILLFTAVAPVSSLEAQERRDRTRVWAGAGLGGGSGRGHAESIALMGELVYQRGPHHLAVRSLTLSDLYGYNALGEVGILYGRTTRSGFGHAVLATGVAYTGFDHNSPNSASSSTIGFPLVAEAALRLFELFGAGVQLFANVNPKTSYGGILVFLQLGWMP